MKKQAQQRRSCPGALGHAVSDAPVGERQGGYMVPQCPGRVRQAVAAQVCRQSPPVVDGLVKLVALRSDLLVFEVG